ncbi:hypothetical protein TELCIR_14667 [Teladorsagia circumcincta]|uniref:Uncharacterized protein n=1 Tax=Teladorsagia circumcincta TaxID=45464 RepID=A0A2G9U0K9_TELCI|nr:hypothetical protein TELCIR_14667 [Teladorsagia circumcincta]
MEVFAKNRIVPIIDFPNRLFYLPASRTRNTAIRKKFMIEIDQLSTDRMSPIRIGIQTLPPDLLQAGRLFAFESGS